MSAKKGALPRLHRSTVGFVGTVTIALASIASSFFLGVRTAGEIHPLNATQAAPQNTAADLLHHIAGDIDGNGELNAADAFRMYKCTQHLEVCSAKENLNGDMNGDLTLDTQDMLRLLGALADR